MLPDSTLGAVAEVHLSFSDTADLRPTLFRIAAFGDIWLVDQWAQRVALMEKGGALRWVTGRKGSGPLEFREIRDVSVLQNGYLAVLDAGLARITILNPRGNAVAHTQLATPARLEQIVPVSDTEFVVFAMGEDHGAQLLHVRSDGSEQGVVQIPWTGYGQVHRMAAQLTLASGGGNTWSAGMLTGPRFFRYEGVSPLNGNTEFIEPVAPPEVVIRTTGNRTTSRLQMKFRAAARVAMSHDIMVVLFEGASDNAGRILDIYRVSTGRYLGTALLVQRPLDIQLFDGSVYGLYEDPIRIVRFTLPEFSAGEDVPK
jgi:hypothetical protein